MILTAPTDNETSIQFVEGAVTFLAVILAFCWPTIGNTFFSSIETTFARLARRKGLAVAIVGCTQVVLRLALLPLMPAPLPFVPDDFSFLLAADTFAHGHLTNATPVMWKFFESIHITMQPSYMSMYFPAQGLIMAFGKIVFGQPWAGILLTTALMCAAICWMLQGWLPPTWALLGGLLAVLRLGLFSYWINTFESGGSIAALGGALVLGALPRFIKQPRLRYAMLMAVGIICVALSRPYEGMLLCVPVLIVLLRWIFFSKDHPAPGLLMRRTALPLAMVIAAGAWLGYYDYRNFGKATTLPYTVDRETYAMAPYYIWQKTRPEPVYRHVVMRRFYHENEADIMKLISTPAGMAYQSLIKVVRGILFFSGLALLPAIFMLPRVIRDRRIRFLVIGIVVLMAGMAIEIFLIPHYLAPFTASFYALGLVAMRHLRVWRPGDRPIGLALVRMMVTICVLMGGVRLAAGQLHLDMHEYPASGWSGNWYGPAHFGEERAAANAKLEAMPGQQLVMVRYSATHNPLDEWVYNSDDIDRSKVVWAREMSPAENRQLMQYYNGRKVWLLQPDLQPAGIQPYLDPMSTEQAAAAKN